MIQGRSEFDDSDKVEIGYSILNPTAMLTISLNKSEGVLLIKNLFTR